MKTLEEIKKEFEKKFHQTMFCNKHEVYPCEKCGGVWNFIESTISQTKQEEENIDWNIDVRYEKDLETAFNKFIEKWCKSNFPHLIDNDENDGEFIRMKIRKLQRKAKSASQTKQELIEEIVDEVVKLSSKYWIDKYLGMEAPLIVNKAQFKKFILQKLSNK